MSDIAAATTDTRPKRWYIVHAYSNFENKVADSIREQAKLRGLADHIDQVLVPKEKVTEARRGRKVETERKFFPGYVLVRMDLTDDVYHLIKNTPKVTGFLGTDKKPMLSDLRESGSIEQDADLVLLVHREDMYERESPRAGEADIIIAKHRNGPVGEVVLTFQKEYPKFMNYAGERFAA